MLIFYEHHITNPKRSLKNRCFLYWFGLLALCCSALLLIHMNCSSLHFFYKSLALLAYSLLFIICLWVGYAWVGKDLVTAITLNYIIMASDHFWLQIHNLSVCYNWHCNKLKLQLSWIVKESRLIKI